MSFFEVEKDEKIIYRTENISEAIKIANEKGGKYIIERSESD